MTTPVEGPALDRLFREARTHSYWLNQPVPDALLHQAWELASMGPTAANSQPARVVFIRSAEAKERLKPALSTGNVAKTMAAPVTALVGYDLEFYEALPRTYPQVDARAWYVGNDEAIRATAFRSGTLQAAYLLMALRAVGLDCGPMSGFDNALVDREFFAGTPVKSNLLINIGFGDTSRLHPRNPRLAFDEACRIV